jgi:hypothetical protein
MIWTQSYLREAIDSGNTDNILLKCISCNAEKSINDYSIGKVKRGVKRCKACSNELSINQRRALQDQMNIDPWLRKLQTLRRKYPRQKVFVNSKDLQKAYNAFNKTCAFTGQPIALESVSFVKIYHGDTLEYKNIVPVFKGVVYLVNKPNFTWPKGSLNHIQSLLTKQ